MNTLDIEMICTHLNNKALASGFFNESIKALEAGADAFVQECCREKNLTSHQISPFRWSFNKDGHEIRSGLIEFEPKADSKSMIFTWVDVSRAKITEPQSPIPVINSQLAAG